MRENIIFLLNYKELSRIVSIYFTQKLKNPTLAEIKVLINEENVNFEVKLWTEKKIVEVLDLD